VIEERKATVVIAERVSSGGHEYSAEALVQMAMGLPGKLVLLKEPSIEEEGGDLRNACGIVEQAISDGNTVTATIRMFSEAPSIAGKFLTPTGSGQKIGASIRSYTPSHLTVSETSAFEHAEKVGEA
jgi:hypothetical protein